MLDVGCGSSRIIGALPEGSIGVDILLRKLRYGRKFGAVLVQASGSELPFPDESFRCVLCSQVIEHVPKESPVLDELDRCLAPGGRLVLGTPDYDNWEWVVTEKLYGWFAPGAYADEHIAHYTYDELIDIFTRRGYTHEATRYILQGELILAFRKGSAVAAAEPTEGASAGGPCRPGPVAWPAIKVRWRCWCAPGAGDRWLTARQRPRSIARAAPSDTRSRTASQC